MFIEKAPRPIIDQAVIIPVSTANPRIGLGGGLRVGLAVRLGVVLVVSLQVGLEVQTEIQISVRAMIKLTRMISMTLQRSC